MLPQSSGPDHTTVFKMQLRSRIVFTDVNPTLFPRRAESLSSAVDGTVAASGAGTRSSGGLSVLL